MYHGTVAEQNGLDIAIRALALATLGCHAFDDSPVIPK